MEAVIFIGLQGAGKSTFYERVYSRTHTRINLDTLKTRHQETLLLTECISQRRKFVVDNTNFSVEQRKRYIAPAREAGYYIRGYYFDAPVDDCLRRNRGRSAPHRVPDVAIYSARKRLQLPTFEEGFSELYFVATTAEGRFIVKLWEERPQLQLFSSSETVAQS